MEETNLPRKQEQAAFLCTLRSLCLLWLKLTAKAQRNTKEKYIFMPLTTSRILSGSADRYEDISFFTIAGFIRSNNA